MVQLTGDIKSDYWLYPDHWPKRNELHASLDPNKLVILYFSFGEKNYIHERFFPKETRNWRYLQQAHSKALVKLAKAYPDKIQIVLKSARKDESLSAEDQETFKEVQNNIFALGKNYRAQDIIVNSDLIIGMQSTAVIESMFTAIPIIYGGWGELHDDVIKHLIPIPDSGSVIIPKNASDFETYLFNVVRRSDFTGCHRRNEE